MNPQDSRAYTYNVIPKLGPMSQHPGEAELPSLLPHKGGLPGLVYFQIPSRLRRLAQDEGWKSTSGTKLYSIIGPRGEIDCELVCKGRIIPGCDTLDNKRAMQVHNDIFEETGLSAETGLPEEFSEEVPEEPLEDAPVIVCKDQLEEEPAEPPEEPKEVIRRRGKGRQLKT